MNNIANSLQSTNFNLPGSSASSPLQWSDKTQSYNHIGLQSTPEKNFVGGIFHNIDLPALSLAKDAIFNLGISLSQNTQQNPTTSGTKILNLKTLINLLLPQINTKPRIPLNSLINLYQPIQSDSDYLKQHLLLKAAFSPQTSNFHTSLLVNTIAKAVNKLSKSISPNFPQTEITQVHSSSISTPTATPHGIFKSYFTMNSTKSELQIKNKYRQYYHSSTPRKVPYNLQRTNRTNSNPTKLSVLFKGFTRKFSALVMLAIKKLKVLRF